MMFNKKSLKILQMTYLYRIKNRKPIRMEVVKAQSRRRSHCNTKLAEVLEFDFGSFASKLNGIHIYNKKNRHLM